MIETESLINPIEEFNPPKYRNWEKEIRHLVRFTSLILIVLLGAHYIQNLDPSSKFLSLSSFGLLLFLFLVFIVFLIMIPKENISRDGEI